MQHVHWPLEIKGLATALPRTSLSSDEIDMNLGFKIGTTTKSVGIASRPVRNDDEDQISLGVAAARKAIAAAGLMPENIDLILFAAAVTYQSIPATAPLIMRELGIKGGQAAAFDINATCLSFLTATDIAASFLKTGRYKTILIVSSELASCALPWHDDPHTASLFGDGAAAAVLTLSDNENSGIVAAHMETWHEGYEDCQLAAGGTRFDPHNDRDTFDRHTYFRMNGKALFRHTMDHFEEFLQNLLNKAGWQRHDVHLVVPHQASPLGLAHIMKRCRLDNAHFINIMKDHGNQIAASIPIALHEAKQKGYLKKETKMLVLGTSAGLSFGGLAMVI